jgi:AcrR family transcriptional regulator
VRAALIERAAEMLARREPVTLRALVQGTEASTMAIYTHFGGMPGLWRAVRQEGFTRLADRLARVERTRDPVRDLMALGAAYTANAFANPHLYRTMFDSEAELEDPDAAGGSFGDLVECAARARQSGRFSPECDPEALATQFWASGHGLIMLALTGVLPSEAVAAHAPTVATALFVAAGDDKERSRRSVRAGWSFEPSPPGP